MGYTTNPYPLEELAREIGQNAIDHGFRHPGAYRDIVTHTALLHSEVSEMFEAWREGDNPRPSSRPGATDRLTFRLQRDETGKPVGVASEIADVIIRALDFCDEYNILIDQVIRDKMTYNRSRPYMHGGKQV